MEGGLEHSQRELERRIFHLKTLYDLSQEIGFSRSPEEIIKNLLLMIMGTFGAFSGLILLIDPKKGTIEASSQRGMDHEVIGTFSKCIESGVFENPLPCNILIWIPFEVDENLRGGIGLGERMTGTHYTNDDRELLTTLSSHGAVAIKNALLIEQMKREEMVRANLARYLSPQVVEQIIHKDLQVNLGGHKSVVTVLFSDIRNFTNITETLQPEQLVQLLNKYFTEMARIIFDNQGSLDKYIGDAIVAVFGSLITLDNSAQNAVSAAKDMMKRLVILREQWQKEYGVSLAIGIGINTGEVFLGNIGSPERMEFTVIGDTVNVASRFSGIAEPGQILLTRQALECLGDYAEYKELPPCEVKGKIGKLEIFEVDYSS